MQATSNLNDDVASRLRNIKTARFAVPDERRASEGLSECLILCTVSLPARISVYFAIANSGPPPWHRPNNIIVQALLNVIVFSPSPSFYFSFFPPLPDNTLRLC